jgi:phage pi2 protein 07
MYPESQIYNTISKITDELEKVILSLSHFVDKEQYEEFKATIKVYINHILDTDILKQDEVVKHMTTHPELKKDLDDIVIKIPNGKSGNYLKYYMSYLFYRNFDDLANRDVSILNSIFINYNASLFLQMY